MLLFDIFPVHMLLFHLDCRFKRDRTLNLLGVKEYNSPHLPETLQACVCKKAFCGG